MHHPPAARVHTGCASVTSRSLTQSWRCSHVGEAVKVMVGVTRPARAVWWWWGHTSNYSIIKLKKAEKKRKNTLRSLHAGVEASVIVRDNK
jgi:hypothetical protein